MCVHVFSLARLFVTPWTVAHQAPLSMGYSRQVWVAVFFSRDLPNPGIETASPVLPVVQYLNQDVNFDTTADLGQT